MALDVADELYTDGSPRSELAASFKAYRAMDRRCLSGNLRKDILSSIPLLVTDVVVVYLAWILCKGVGFLLTGSTIAPGNGSLIAISIVYPVMLYTQGLYPGLIVEPAEELQRVFTAAAMATIGFVVASFVYRDYEAFHVPIRVLNFILLFACGFLGRMTVRDLLSKALWWKQKVSIVGDHVDRQKVERWLEKNGQLGVTSADELGSTSDNVILASLRTS